MTPTLINSDSLEITEDSSDDYVLNVEDEETKKKKQSLAIKILWYILMVLVRLVSIPVIAISTIIIWIVWVSIFVICYCLVLITFIVINPVVSLLCYVLVGNTVYSDQFLETLQGYSLDSYKYLTTPLHNSRFNYCKCNEREKEEEDKD